MKKIKNYLFIFIMFVLTIFVVSNNSVSALDDVVFNPNSNGEGNYVYDGIQYTLSRDIDIAINVEQSELDTYDTMFNICEYISASSIDNTREQEKCSSYLTEQGNKRFQISGRNDGEKKLIIYFYSNFENKAVARKIEKKITLDTTGPIINLTGGEYIYLLQGEIYSELGATCEDDSGVVSETCVVEIEPANIDMNKKGYQYIRYKAVDFLGNEVNTTRKIVVEQIEEKSKDIYWIGAGIGIAILAAFLFIKVFQNKEKQKNQSVL